MQLCKSVVVGGAGGKQKKRVKKLVVSLLTLTTLEIMGKQFLFA